MESLQDLGGDTLYTSGEPINPIKESEGQPNCRPITGWQFTLGSGIQEKASKGPWGALSIVTAPSADDHHESLDAAARLDAQPVKGQSLGATTFELTPAQADARPVALSGSRVARPPTRSFSVSPASSTASERCAARSTT